MWIFIRSLCTRWWAVLCASWLISHLSGEETDRQLHLSLTVIQIGPGFLHMGEKWEFYLPNFEWCQRKAEDCMTLQQELVDFSLSRTARVIGEINWITLHVELNVFSHYLPAVCQPQGHYQGMSHIKMTELDWLCWENSWPTCHRLWQLLTSSPHASAKSLFAA